MRIISTIGQNGMAAILLAASFALVEEPPRPLQLEAANRTAAPADSAIDKGVPPARHAGDAGNAPEASPPAGSGALEPAGR